ncbi:hypothetical protein B0A48_02850 [Cryoendolithus antarcticus]|uniref:Uncharacterized protein n=1 Tax=Cryoendolithus antarcticus TaxID=1507870 RepID=A0A1V8TLF8_9PEZI|nr:hypothetical protein B0A48_02850 [Cryoendolithus antarcticus]
MLTYAHKRRWFYPSSTLSQAQTILTNLEMMLDSMSKRGASSPPSLAPGGSQARTKTPYCRCNIESRWLNPWLCVPCLNASIFATPTHDACTSLASSPQPLPACLESEDVGALIAPHNLNSEPAHSLPTHEHAASDCKVCETRRKGLLEWCGLCGGKLGRFDAARRGRCLPPEAESVRRMGMRLSAVDLGRKRGLLMQFSL